GVNNDSFDDAVVDDGCTGGPAQAGAFSEAQFRIGTHADDPCGGDAYPLDLIPGGFQPNTINIQDLASYVAPVRIIGTKPGDANFSARHDMLPGTTFGTPWINVNDLGAFVANTPTGYPPMHNGQRTFSQACPFPP
ncbi:MAG: hypothetical protein ACREUU_18270, partial [Gammaproteobacteria bacterium]